MSKKLYFPVLLLLICILPKIVFAFGEQRDILIKFKNDKEITDVSQRYNIYPEQIEEIRVLNVFKVDNSSWWQRLKVQFDKIFSNQIEYVEPDCQYQSFSTPNDKLYNEQWSLSKISAPAAWDNTTGNDAIKIAIIDTGIDGIHEDLSGKVFDGYNAITDSPISANSNSDDHGHGSAIAGIAAAATNNFKGIAGLGWQVRLMPIKVLDKNGVGYSFDVAKGIIYAVDNGVKIINLSLGGNSLSDTLKSAIDYAHDQKGAILIAAAGNNNGSISYPARYNKVLAVGSTSRSDNRLSFSNYGPELAVMAPGEQILTTNNKNGYENISGTSASVPLVSGLAALLWSTNDNLSNNQIKIMIENNTDKVSGMEGQDFSQYYGYGRINAYKAVNTGQTYQAGWVSQNGNPTLAQGQAYNFFVKFKNTGTKTWTKTSVYLGTDQPQNRITLFDRNNSGNPSESSRWVSANRIEMLEGIVDPGEIATFSFWMNTPQGIPLGTYREHFCLIADEITWIDNSNVFWDINVIPFQESYHHQWLSQNEYPSISPGQGYNFVLNVKNTGSITWYRGSVNLGTDEPQDRTSSFIRADVNDPYGHPSHWISSNRIEMLQESVAPGETATFSFWMSAPSNMSPGTYREYFRLVADGITWMEDYGIYWDVSVDYPHAQWVGQSGYPLLHPGEKTTVWIEFKNTGQSTWNKYGSNPVNLGTDRPRDRTSRFHFSDWSSENRISLDQTSVPPGGVGRYSFTFNIPADTNSGTYREYFRLVADGMTWLEDYGVYIEINVN